MELANLTEEHDQNWAELDMKTRAILVDHLRSQFSKSFWDDAARVIDLDPTEWWIDFHFSVGMTLRNSLRKVLTDQQLPGYPQKHWDDYWVPVTEAAAGKR